MPAKNPTNLTRAQRLKLLIGALVVVGSTWVFTRPDGTTVVIPFPVDAAVDSSIDSPSIDAPPDAAAGTIDPFTPWVQSTIASHATCDGADGTNVGDFNGDGKSDIVTACEQGNKIVVARRTGTCAAGQPVTYDVIVLPAPAAGQGSVIGPEDARFGDIDNDGDLDVVIAESASAKLRWFKNNGSGGASPFDQPVKIGEGTQCDNSGTPVICRYMHGLVYAPGVVFAGSYSTGAEVSRFNCNDTPCTTASTWTHTKLSAANWVKGLEVHTGPGSVAPTDDDLLVWDYLGPLKGVRWINDATVGTGTLGTRLTSDSYTLRGTRKSSTIAYAVGTSDGLSAGTTFAIVGGATATYPSGFGRAQAVNLCDLDGDGNADMVVTASHANDPVDDITEPPSAVASVMWIKGPGFTVAGEISGVLGIKHDNAECVDVDCDGDLDIVTTEEKSLGLIWYENPRIP